MKKALAVFLGFVLVSMGCGTGPGVSSSSGGGGGSGSKNPARDIKAVNHIILLMQENRSFDHYLGKLNDYRAKQGLSQDVDGLPATVTPLPTWDGSPALTPFHINTMCIDDLSSSWVEAHLDVSLSNASNPGPNPPMNGFAKMAGGYCAHTGCGDVAGKRAMGYYTEADLPFYYWLATQFATSDRWFSAAPTRTQPNRMYFLAATSQGFVYPSDSTHPGWGLSAKTIYQLLQENNITWKVYVTDGWKQGTTGATYMNYFSGFASKYVDNFVSVSQFATDAQAGTLPQVALIETGYEKSGSDEHPLNNVQRGANYARDLVTSLINSPSWKDSVFFITYDEGGGLYDHVPPAATVNPDGIKPRLDPGDPQGDFTVTGFRVPLFVVSPFARPHFVSHTVADFTALLKFIEERFSLPSLNKRDAAQPSMVEYFDFTSSPNLDPGTVAVQPTNGNCYYGAIH